MDLTWGIHDCDIGAGVVNSLAKSFWSIDVSHGKVLGGCLAHHKSSPSIVTFVDDIHGIFLVLSFSPESENILRFTVRCIERPLSFDKAFNIFPLTDLVNPG